MSNVVRCPHGAGGGGGVGGGAPARSAQQVGPL